MRLAIAGGSGQLGSQLGLAARDRGYDVRSFSRASLDLERPDQLHLGLADASFDVLINCAAHHGTDRMERVPGPAFVVNARAVEVLARLCRDREAALVQVSTDYVFPGTASRPYREDDPPGPLNVYGASKLVGEGLARAAHPDGAVVVRTASLFGRPAAPREPSNFVETVLRAADRGEPLRVVDDVVMSPTSAADLATGLLDLVESGAGPGVYHMVNSGEASWHEFARAILDIAGLSTSLEPVSSESYGAAARRPPYSVLDTGRIAALDIELGDWRTALEAYLAGRVAR